MTKRFKFGDIIENGYASDSNPRKRGIYLWSFNRTGRLNPGKHVKLLHEDGKTGELLISADDNMTVVGTIFDAKVSEDLAAKDAEIERLREALEACEQQAESIRLIFINHLEEPERSAFWKAVNIREFARAALHQEASK